MGCAPAVFSFDTWIAQFPEFSAVNPTQAQFYFDLATIIWRNDGCGPVSNPNTQLNLLNLLTSHLATQYSQSLGDPSPGSPQDANTPVGRINNATEGSVSVQTDYGTNISQQMAWAITTKYGSLWWAMTAQYRTAVYMPGLLQPGGLGPGVAGAGYFGPGGYGGGFGGRPVYAPHL